MPTQLSSEPYTFKLNLRRLLYVISFISFFIFLTKYINIEGFHFSFNNCYVQDFFVWMILAICMWISLETLDLLYKTHKVKPFFISTILFILIFIHLWSNQPQLFLIFLSFIHLISSIYNNATKDAIVLGVFTLYFNYSCMYLFIPNQILYLNIVVFLGVMKYRTSAQWSAIKR